jgi:hypothetical protein
MRNRHGTIRPTPFQWLNKFSPLRQRSFDLDIQIRRSLQRFGIIYETAKAVITS